MQLLKLEGKSLVTIENCHKKLLTPLTDLYFGNICI